MRGDRHDSTVGKHTHTQPGAPPKTQQTITAFNPSAKSGGQERQDDNGNKLANLQHLKHLGQMANQTLSSSSKTSSHPSNHMRDLGKRGSHDARLSDKQHIHETARSSGSHTSHQSRIHKDTTRQATTGVSKARFDIGERLKASVPKQQQPPHKHPSSQRVQTQTHAQIPPPPSSSSAYKPVKKEKEAHLARLAEKDDDEDSWSARNVAMYEASALAPSVMARQTHASTSIALPTPKPVAPRQQPPSAPPPPPVVAHPKLPSSALRKPHGSILQQLSTQGKRERERKARAQHDLAADDDDEKDLPEVRRQRENFFGSNVNHRSWKYPAATATSSYRAPQHTDNTPTQNITADHDAKQPLAHGSNNLSGIHPDSLPSIPSLQYKPDDENESESTDEPVPTGPFSLNSAAGIRAIEKTIPSPPARPMVLPYETTSSSSSRTTTQRFMGSGGNTNSSRRAKIAGPRDSPAFIKAPLKPQLYITSNDLHLYKWRAEKLTWADTRDRWSKLPGTADSKTKSEDSLRGRFRAVAKLIETDEVSQELCSAVLEGVEGAEEELNRIVAELQQQQAEPELQLQTGGFRKISSGKNGGGVKQEPVRQQQQISATQQQQNAANVPPDPPLAVAGTCLPSPPRSTQGGKFYDASTFQAYIEHIAEAREQEDDADSDSNCFASNSREASPVQRADYCKWEYYMQRRDFTCDDISALPEGQQDPTASFEEIEDDAENSEEIYNPSTRWKTYTQPFYALSDANAEAVRFLWTTPMGSPQTYSAAGSYSFSTHVGPFAMSTFSVKSELGLSQVRVARRLLTYQDHVVPQREEKEGWVPRVLWCVVVKVRDNRKGKEGVEVDGESPVLSNKIFSSLNLANTRAIDEWLKLTLKIRSANLSQRKIEMESAKATLLNKLERVGHGGDEDDDDSGERAKKFKEVLVEGPADGETGGGRRVEVFVQEVGLEGPRN
jgi:hypothetical protein